MPNVASLYRVCHNRQALAMLVHHLGRDRSGVALWTTDRGTASVIRGPFLYRGMRLGQCVSQLDFAWQQLPIQARRGHFSAGVTEALPDDDRNLILRRADRALYAAKEEGRDRTRIGFEGIR